MTVTRLQIARWLGWIGVIAFFSLIVLDSRLQHSRFSWVTYGALITGACLVPLIIRKWGGEAAQEQTHKGMIEAFVSFSGSAMAVLLILFVGLLVFLFALSLWSIVRG